MLEVARRILAEAGRPLSARKILELAEQAGGAGTPLDLAGLREALEGAPGVKEVRRGVFGLVEEAPPAPVVEADDSDSEDRKRRRRRPKAKELLGDEPVAALSVEDAVAQAEAAVDTESHRRTLWTQVRDRAAAAVTDEALPPVPQLAPPVEDEGRAGRGRRARQEGRGRRSERGGDEPLAAAPVVAAPVAAAPVAAPVVAAPVVAAPLVAAPVAAAPVAPVAKAPPVAKAAPRAAEKAREEAPRIDKPRENAKESKSLRDALRARLKAWASALPKVVKVAIPKPEPLTPTPRKVANNSAADILARLSARRRVRPAQAVPQPVVAAPVVAASVVAAPVVAAPVVAAPVAAAAPAREETRPPRPAEEGLAAQVRGVLLVEDRTASMRRIAERLGEEAGAVRAAVVADNARHAAAGQRSLFVLLPDGSVGLSEWTLTERYLDLEEKIQHALAEQEEMVRRDLLDRVANLSDAAFEQVVTLLLERLGHDDVRTVHRQGSTLALLTHRDGEPVAIVARRARSVVGLETVQALEASLPRFHADRGLLVTVGEFDDKARQAARKASVQLLDGAAFARALYTHDIGVSRHQPTFRYPDAAFFAGLG